MTLIRTERGAGYYNVICNDVIQILDALRQVFVHFMDKMQKKQQVLYTTVRNVLCFNTNYISYKYAQ